MKKTKLKLSEVRLLNAELQGIATSKGQTKGLLNENIPIKTKYWISRLGEIVAKEEKSVSESINELIKKYGTAKEGDDQVFEVQVKDADGNPNPDFTKFEKEIEDLLNQEIEVEHAEFSLEMFDEVSSNLRLDIFFKLL